MQADGAVHDTPASCVFVVPGLATGAIFHDVPFQASASGCRVPPPTCWVYPTAMHASGAAQDTPSRTLAPAPAGSGVGWTAQLPPRHASARVTWVPSAL